MSCFCFVLNLGILLNLAFAQEAATTPTQFTQEVASQHLVTKVEAVYPPIAGSARLQGDVYLQIVVDERGTVTSVKVISGHPFFTQSAVDAIRQWRYTPFTSNGATVSARIPVRISFSLGISAEEAKKESAAADAYFEKEQVCRSALKSQTTSGAEAPCQALPSLADALPESRHMERLSAYKYAGHAFFYDRRFQESLPYYQKELEIAQATLTDTNAELGYAYRDVAHAQHGTGQLAQAKPLYERALEILEKSRSHIESAFLKNEYSKTIQSTLREYAILLKQSGDNAGAESAENKAASMEIKQGLKDQ